LKSSDIRKDRQSDIREVAFWMLLLALKFDECVA